MYEYLFDFLAACATDRGRWFWGCFYSEIIDLYFYNTIAESLIIENRGRVSHAPSIIYCLISNKTSLSYYKTLYQFKHSIGKFAISYNSVIYIIHRVTIRHLGGIGRMHV